MQTTSLEYMFGRMVCKVSSAHNEQWQCQEFVLAGAQVGHHNF